MSSRFSAALLSTLILVVAAVPALAAEPAAKVAAQPVAQAQAAAAPAPEAQDFPRFTLKSLQIGDILFAASKGDGKTRTNNQMKATGAGNALCEWFIISCNSGGGDYCCGSVGSCLGYCEEICGPPCVYEN
jgi:hypothetical protein